MPLLTSSTEIAHVAPAPESFQRFYQEIAAPVHAAEKTEAALSWTRMSRELLAARKQLEAAERRIRQLESELAHVSELVREDPLTGALNRRGLEEAFRRESARAERCNMPLSAALLDIDDFKRLNDAHGHHAGDEALRHMVQVVRATLRPNDLVARWGGEEFLILLPDAGTAEAAAVTERLQHALARTLFCYNGRHLPITFSAGVTLRAAGEALPILAARADQALYRAKRGGKKRVVAA